MFRRFPALATIGGIAIAFGVAGLLGLLLAYGVQPWISTGTWGRTCKAGDRVNLWYADGSDSIRKHAELRADLERLIDETSARIGLDPTLVPRPIDVFPHDSEADLIESLTNRKADTTATIGPSLDLMSGEDPRLRVAELVLSHGWGACASQIIYLGTVLLIAYPDRDFHSVVAALPATARHSVSELMTLDTVGLSKTFYQTYTSPTAARYLVSLEAASELTRAGSSWKASPEERIEALEAASLMQYVVERAGTSAVLGGAWGPGFAGPVLERVTGMTIGELDVAWQTAADERGPLCSDYPAELALRRLESGDCDGAYEVAAEWDPEDLEDRSFDVMVRAAFLSGHVDVAQGLLETADRMSEFAWIADLRAVDSEQMGTIRLLCVGEAACAISAAVLDRVCSASLDALGIESDGASLPLTVVCYPTSEDVARAASLTETSGVFCPIVSCVSGEDPSYDVAVALPSTVFGATRSKILACGFATCITHSREALILRGRALRDAGKWQPLGSMECIGKTSSAVDVQAGLLVLYLMETRGGDVVGQIWARTARRGGGRSLDTAMDEAIGETRRTIESDLLLWLDEAA